ncbi:CHAT domain-containing protein [Ancylothrix sp. C2]|uniref:CHAT domain-containing protein n=1 Tax=Ancylothrix sp. D3o TaxID=2953691 RepID=UPI0021BB19D3|nr:CHAT domain-containing protein [Ancylothrix sp. D3o]MCT7948431.1 CHAT domain-containing protein [Ancylothrix sp. D3o]
MTQELEFQISVTPVRGNEYLVRTEDVVQGAPLAEEILEWPVDDWLVRACQLMNDPLLGLLEESDMAWPSQTGNGKTSLGEVGSSPEAGVASLVALGRQLHQHLFQGRLRDSWISAQSIAQHRRSQLRLRLALKGDVLPRLPWEVLHDGNRPIATGTDVLFSRYQPPTTALMSEVVEGTHKQTTSTALKILMVLAGPTDQDRLQLKQEAEHLQRELLSRSESGGPAMQLQILEQPDRATLTQALEHNQYQVFHYAGHSNLGSKGGELYLVNRKTGLTETLTGYDLAGLLANNGVQLAVFNSCRGAGMLISGRNDDTGLGNLAEALVNRGIPGVLAMAECIPDDVALTLARLFYRNLNLGQSVDLSLSRARQGLISAYGSNQLYWALPILYLHPKFDGYLRSNYHINSISSSQSEVVSPILSQIRSPQVAEPDDLENLDDEEIDSILDEMDYAELKEDLGLFKDDELMDLEGENEAWDDDFNEEPLDDGAEAMVASLLRQLSPPDPLPAGGNPPASNVIASEMRQADLIFSDEELEEYDLQKYQQSTEAIDSNSQERESSESNVKANSGDLSRTKTPRLIAPAPEKLNNAKKTLPPVDRSAWIPKALVGVVAVGLLPILGFWFLRSRVEEKNVVGNSGKQAVTMPVESEVPVQSLNTLDFQKTPTSQVVAIAIERFSQGNLKEGFPAVEALLNRSALPQAQAALAAIPKAQENQPEVNFLKGRLVWQFAAAGNQLYSQSDARRFWEVAVKDNGKSAEYFNALGFAYYAEGNFDRAAQMWSQVLNLLENNPQQNSTIRQDLTAYSGSALVFYKQARSLAGEQKEVRLSKAIKFRNYVLSEDAVSFQPDALAKNWMWSDQAIKDWQGVLQLKE